MFEEGNGPFVELLSERGKISDFRIVDETIVGRLEQAQSLLCILCIDGFGDLGNFAFWGEASAFREDALCDLGYDTILDTILK